MKIVLQRVTKAVCIVDNQVIGQIDNGYLLFVGFKYNDTSRILEKAVKKIVNLRIFEDENGKMNLNLEKVNGSILSISQFTLYANTKEGNRPSFSDALNPENANELYNQFNNLLRKHFKVETGKFKSHMDIHLVNDGPVTIIIEMEDEA